MGSLHFLIEKQFKNYLLRKRLLREKKEEHFRPCIFFSRENGSGGRAIAQAVAKKLGFKFYDEELIEMIAKKTHLKKDLVKSVDEKAQGTIEAIINTFLGFEPLPEHEYIRNLIRVVLSIAHKGKAVILGRGSNFIIPPKHVLRVRIVAPFKVRLENSCKFEYPNRRLSAVRERMLKVHLERKDFVRKYFGKDISNANYYDLVINTEHLTIDQATNIVLAAFKTRF